MRPRAQRGTQHSPARNIGRHMLRATYGDVSITALYDECRAAHRARNWRYRTRTGSRRRHSKGAPYRDGKPRAIKEIWDHWLGDLRPRPPQPYFAQTSAMSTPSSSAAFIRR